MPITILIISGENVLGETQIPDDADGKRTLGAVSTAIEGRIVQHKDKRTGRPLPNEVAVVENLSEVKRTFQKAAIKNRQ